MKEYTKEEKIQYLLESWGVNSTCDTQYDFAVEQVRDGRVTDEEMEKAGWKNIRNTNNPCGCCTGRLSFSEQMSRIFEVKTEKRR